MPAGWRSLTPHEIAGQDKKRLVIGPFGSSLRTSDYETAGVPLVFVRDIRAGDFSAPRAFVSPGKGAQLRAHEALTGDVLITKMGEPPGDATVYTGARPAIITADCIRLRPTDDHDAKYVAWALQSPAVRRQVEWITSGVAQRKVSLARFRGGVLVPMARITEQRRVVEILEDHLGHLDAADAELRRAQSRSDALLLSALRTHVDSLRSEGAPFARIGELASTKLGKMLDAKKATGDLTPYLANINVRWGHFDLKNLKSVRLTTEERDRLTMLPGDLIVCEGGEPGRCAVWELEDSGIAYQKALHRVRVHDAQRLDPDYLALMLRENIQSGRADRLFTGTTIKHLPQEKLRLIEIPLPDLTVQRTVLGELRGVAESSERLAVALQAATSRSEALRRTVLAAAFDGKLTGRHTDQEVIEELAAV